MLRNLWSNFASAIPSELCSKCRFPRIYSCAKAPQKLPTTDQMVASSTFQRALVSSGMAAHALVSSYVLLNSNLRETYSSLKSSEQLLPILFSRSMRWQRTGKTYKGIVHFSGLENFWTSAFAWFFRPLWISHQHLWTLEPITLPPVSTQWPWHSASYSAKVRYQCQVCITLSYQWCRS